MAHEEHDREDLLREATALIERAELQIAGDPEPVVIGFRRDGSFSIFFGGDPVYQFNSASELRRAFVDGLLYKAERGQLIGLRRERTAGATVLVRQTPNAEEQMLFLSAARERLRLLCLALEGNRFKLIGQMPPEANVVGRVQKWLSTFAEQLVVANRPHSG